MYLLICPFQLKVVDLEAAFVIVRHVLPSFARVFGLPIRWDPVKLFVSLDLDLVNTRFFSLVLFPRRGCQCTRDAAS